MTQFRFRLEPLVKLRVAERDRRREELANAYRAEQVLHERQQLVTGEIEDTQQQAKACSAPGTIHVDRLLNAHRYELVLHAQLQQLRRQQQVLTAEIERRREALVEADRELRMLEKLREKHARDFESSEHKAQIRLLDEMALRRRKAISEFEVR